MAIAPAAAGCDYVSLVQSLTLGSRDACGNRVYRVALRASALAYSNTQHVAAFSAHPLLVLLFLLSQRHPRASDPCPALRLGSPIVSCPWPTISVTVTFRDPNASAGRHRHTPFPFAHIGKHIHTFSKPYTACAQHLGSISAVQRRKPPGQHGGTLGRSQRCCMFWRATHTVGAKEG